MATGELLKLQANPNSTAEIQMLRKPVLTTVWGPLLLGYSNRFRMFLRYVV
jgi:hypothetical protein